MGVHTLLHALGSGDACDRIASHNYEICALLNLTSQKLNDDLPNVSTTFMVVFISGWYKTRHCSL